MEAAKKIILFPPLADQKKVTAPNDVTQVIQGEYWELVTEQDSLAWFSIVPKST